MAMSPDEFNERLAQRNELVETRRLMDRHRTLIGRADDLHKEFDNLPKKIKELLEDLNGENIPDYGLRKILDFLEGYGQPSLGVRRNIFLAKNPNIPNPFAEIARRNSVDEDHVISIYDKRIARLLETKSSYRRLLRLNSTNLVIYCSIGQQSVTSDWLSERIGTDHGLLYKSGSIRFVLRGLTAAGLYLKLTMSSYRLDEKKFVENPTP